MEHRGSGPSPWQCKDLSGSGRDGSGPVRICTVRNRRGDGSGPVRICTVRNKRGDGSRSVRICTVRICLQHACILTIHVHMEASVPRLPDGPRFGLKACDFVPRTKHFPSGPPRTPAPEPWRWNECVENLLCSAKERCPQLSQLNYTGCPPECPTFFHCPPPLPSPSETSPIRTRQPRPRHNDCDNESTTARSLPHFPISSTLS